MIAGNSRLSVVFGLFLVLLAACSGIQPGETPTLPTLAIPTWMDTETSSPLPDTATPTASLTPTPSSTATPTGIVNLMAVGDIMLGRTVGDQVLAEGPQVVLAGVKSVLNMADVRIGNLECAITSLDQPADKGYTLKAPPETAQALAGFDLVSLSNNHAMDFGFPGLVDTQDYLGQNGIATVGAGLDKTKAHTPFILERNGLKMAFLAYIDVPLESNGFDARDWMATDSQPGIAWADPVLIAADITAAKTQADVVIVQLHSGYEVSAYIPSISTNQQAEAHAAIDAGAALVIGSHPHILQRLERYHGGLIAYSLGNFIFDKWLGIVNESLILNVTLDKTGVQDFEWIPIIIVNGLPKLATPWDSSTIATMVAPR